METTHWKALTGNQGEEEEPAERCRREIAAIEAELRAGHPDVAGLCLALSDWSAELRIIEREAALWPRQRSIRIEVDRTSKADL
jgi:hypothetical protein